MRDTYVLFITPLAIRVTHHAIRRALSSFHFQAREGSKLAELLQAVYKEVQAAPRPVLRVCGCASMYLTSLLDPSSASKVGALKSREASSENVLRVAKETLDARKKQVKRKGLGIRGFGNSGPGV